MSRYDAYTQEMLSQELEELAGYIKSTGQTRLLYDALGGASTLELLKMEAARRNLSRLLITRNYRFILPDYNDMEIDLQPVHKAVYMLFLAHPEGIEFKRLHDMRDELLSYYYATARSMDKAKIEESVTHLVNPLDNAINEKCSRIKNAFFSQLDDYTAMNYIISSHTQKHFARSSRIWFERLKVITLPRELVTWEGTPLFTLKDKD